MYLAVAGIKVRIEGLDRISSPPYVFMCNHQSALDIHALMTQLPFSFKWIAKRQLFAIPLFGWALKKAGYISIDRENPREALKAMEEASRRIREGTNIIIFPEGTRSADGKLLPFKKGGFHPGASGNGSGRSHRYLRFKRIAAKRKFYSPEKRGNIH